MAGGLTIGAAPGYKAPAKRLASYTLRWWSQVQVPYIHHGSGPFTDTEIRYHTCWAQTILHAITEDEAQMLQLMLGAPGGSWGYRTNVETNNWLLQRLMAGVNGTVYGIHLQLDTPAQATQRQPLRTMLKDPLTAAQTYGGVTGTVLAPGVHPCDLGV